jgi:hypothetical protein
MKKVILLIILALLLFVANNTVAQVSISGIINTNSDVTAVGQPNCSGCGATCRDSVTVDNGSSFLPGDRALIIQMKGAVINTANTSSAGQITSIGNAGNYEFFIIDSVGGNFVYPRFPFVKQYDDAGQIQVIRIPNYGQNDVQVDGILTAPTWDEASGTGGVVALVAKKLILNANIDVIGSGFKGTQMLNNGTPDNCSVTPTSAFTLSSTASQSFTKGEGIVVNDNAFNRGRGPRANGGGSGISGDSGGGGGSNFGAGGTGGKRWCDEFGAVAGGIGGVSLASYFPEDRVFLGGAGGSGFVTTNNPSDATDGGGIVILFVETLVGNGFSILADGTSPVGVNPTGAPDGGGGGGGGGTVLLKVQEIQGSLTISTNGGDGQDLNTVNYHGPGGGGGGGVLLYSLPTLPGAVTYTANGGAAGRHSDGVLNDSEPGQAGGSYSLYVPIENANYTTNVDEDDFAAICDIDDDNDGITDYQEIYVGDHDGDGTIDYEDADFCIAFFNGVNGWDCATDGLPDPSDDLDGDGRPNFSDADFPYCGSLIAGVDQICSNFDPDGDGIASHLDLDSDNDGIPDIIEHGGTDINGDGFADSSLDDDQDGLVDLYDSDDSDGPNGSSPCTTQPGCLINSTVTDLQLYDSDGDGIINSQDLDSDNDGIPDAVEAGFVDENGDGYKDNYSDTDNDGFTDALDPAVCITSLGFGTYDAASIDIGGTTTNANGVPNDNFVEVYDPTSNLILDFGFVLDVGSDYSITWRRKATYSAGPTADMVVEESADGVNWIENLPRPTDATQVFQTTVISNDILTRYIRLSTETGTNDDFDFDAVSFNSVSCITGQNPLTTGPDLNNDGIPDSYPNSDADGDGIVDWLDLDADNDGIPDVVEAGGTDENGDGRADDYVDADNDGFNDVVDGDPANVLVLSDDSPGTNTVNALQITSVDADNDGRPDTQLSDDFDGDGIPNQLDLDADNDGIPDVVEAGGTDENGDGRADDYLDADGDGFNDRVDGDPTNALALGTDTDGANSGDALLATGPDANLDGVPDSYDEHDTDGDGVLDFLDLDADNDGIPDVVEAGGTDENGDGRADDYLDADGDGFNDRVDGDPTNALALGIDTDGANSGDALLATGPDANLDGVPDSYSEHDTDGDGVLDFLDLDADNDGIPDVVEAGGTDENGDGRADDYLDADGDGFNDRVDGDPTNALALGTDTDGANSGDALLATGPDANLDGVPDSYDEHDFDGDGVLNFLDLDSDDDGILDVVEAGGTDANRDGQEDNYVDTDGDGYNDLVDGDTDNSLAVGDDSSDDNTSNSTTLTGLDANLDGVPDSYPNDDFDGDGLFNFIDIDADNDGIVDNTEGQSTAGYVAPAGTDADGDGIDDAYDNNDASFGGASSSFVLSNIDSTDEPDYLDDDSDNDGYSDLIEGHDSDGDFVPDGGSPASTGLSGGNTDSDGDGLLDGWDNNTSSTDPTNGSLTPSSHPDQVKPATAERDWRELLDNDNDGITDLIDIDDDNDGIKDGDENECVPFEAYWKLDNNTDDFSSIHDERSTGNAPGFSTESIQGTHSANFNGTTNEIRYSQNGGFMELLYSTISFSAWIKPTDVSGSRVIYEEGGGTNGFMLWIEDGIITATARSGGAGSQTSVASDLPVIAGDLWYHVATTFDNGTITVYVNGVSNSVLAAYSTIPNHGSDGGVGGPLGGAPNGITGYYAGLMDGVKYSNTQAWSSVEIGYGCDADGDNVVDRFDLDSDNDGIPDLVEAGGVDTDGDGRIDGYTDGDGDGLGDTYDSNDGGDDIQNADTDGDGVKDYLDLDTDNDGIPDVVEAGGTDTDGDGVFDDQTDIDGDGFADDVDGDVGNDGTAENNTNALQLTGTDSDSDGVPNSYPSNDIDQDGIPNQKDLDADNDGIPDVVEAGGTDIDGDGIFDNQTDTDGDGFADVVDGDVGNDGTSENNANALQLTGVDTDNDGAPNSYPEGDTDGDGVLDQLDLDADNDGIPDVVEAGGTDANGDGIFDDQTDTDNDGFADDVDGDVGNDGTAENSADGLQLTGTDTDNDGAPNSYPAGDTDGDGILDQLDLDADGDGIPDVVEAGGTDVNGDGRFDDQTDTDNDGFADDVDGDVGNDGTAENTANALQITGTDTDNDGAPNSVVSDDFDGDGIPNQLDLDSDGDGITDVIEAGGTDANFDGIEDGTELDTDNDGLDDGVDGDVGNDGTAENTANAQSVTGADTDNDGEPNSYPQDDFDGDGKRDYLDIDSDNDGITDNAEAMATASYVAPSGSDTDGDGIDNAYDPTNSGTYVVPTNTDGTDTPDYLDLDSDNDSFSDLLEGHDSDGNGVADGSGPSNTGFSGGTTDADNDGLYDGWDNNTSSTDPTNGSLTPSSHPDVVNVGGDRDWREVKDTDEDGVPDLVDLDDDNDGIPDIIESDGNEPDGDEDGDGILNWLDIADGGNGGDNSTTDYTDGDGNGIPDVYDFDGDGIPNHLDKDSDNDGIVDILEAEGTDANQDGEVDYPIAGDPTSMLDADNDGLDDNRDDQDGGAGGSEVTDGSPWPLPNSDGAGEPNYLDIDADDDGIVDNTEAQATDSYIAPTGLDDDRDGIDNAYDPDCAPCGAITGAYIDPVNTDGTDEPDYTDTDSDNDGESDAIEGHDTDGDGIADAGSPASDGVSNGSTDADGDGLLDGYDNNPASKDPTNGGLEGTSHPDFDGAESERDWREVPCPSGTVVLAPNNATTTASDYCRESGFTYYYNPSDPTELLFAIEHKPLGGNTNDFTVEIDITTSSNPTQQSGVYSEEDIPNEEATFVMGRYFNFNITSGSLNGSVNIRFFYDTDEADTLLAVAQRWNDDNAGSTSNVSGLRWFAVNSGTFEPASALTSAGVTNSRQLSPSGTSTEDGVSYSEFSTNVLTGGGLGYTVGNNSVILPVEMLSFTVVMYSDSSGLLRWVTASEINSDYFEVQHAISGGEWKVIGELAAAGNSNDILSYQFVHPKLSVGENFYRLRQVDIDGQDDFTGIRILQYAPLSEVEVYPNPTKDQIFIQSGKKDRILKVEVMTTSGQMINLNIVQESETLWLTSFERLAAGSYIVLVSTVSGIEVFNIQKVD